MSISVAPCRIPVSVLNVAKPQCSFFKLTFDSKTAKAKLKAVISLLGLCLVAVMAAVGGLCTLAKSTDSEGTKTTADSRQLSLYGENIAQ